jgi:uncharacterized protein (TIGR02145 family)
MKQLFTFLTLVSSLVVFCQAPNAMSYQAVIRDVSNDLVSNQSVGMQISILQGSASGISVYTETQSPTTNANGLVSIAIGEGSTNDDFSGIDWADGPYFVKTETDPNGASDYSITGTTQLLSVPYAMHAKTADNMFSGDYDSLENKPDLSIYSTTDTTLSEEAVDAMVADNGYLTSDSVLSEEAVDAMVADNGYLTSDSVLSEEAVDAMVADNGYVTTLNDDDATNEIQNLSVSASGDTLHLQNGGFVIIPGISAANAPPELPTITTASVSSITDSSAASGGTIDTNGGAAITSSGVVWYTVSNPTLESNIGVTTENVASGSFVSNITGLNASTTYYVRAYASNSEGTAYGNEVSFTILEEDQGTIFNPDLTYGSMTDQDGNEYATIVIGTQEWMAENLRTSTYNDGSSIEQVRDDDEWFGLSSPAWCYYNNTSNTDTIETYGALYNYYAAADTNSKNVCPIGWHVPSDAEWTVLTDYLGGEDVAGAKMKSIGTAYWQNPNHKHATNESGFSGLPGGSRVNDGAFNYRGGYGDWWSAAELNAKNAWSRYVGYNVSYVIRSNYGKEFGLSVRCVRD